jgi:hypothetical protein
MKETMVAGKKNIEFHAEVFNFVNHPKFDEPYNFFPSSAFGQIFDTLGRTLVEGISRQIQSALRFNY